MDRCAAEHSGTQTVHSLRRTDNVAAPSQETCSLTASLDSRVLSLNSIRGQKAFLQGDHARAPSCAEGHFSFRLQRSLRPGCWSALYPCIVPETSA